MLNQSLPLNNFWPLVLDCPLKLREYLLTFPHDNSLHFRRQLFSPLKSGWEVRNTFLPLPSYTTCPGPVVSGTSQCQWSPPKGGSISQKKKNRNVSEPGEIITAKDSNFFLIGLQPTKQAASTNVFKWETGKMDPFSLQQCYSWRVSISHTVLHYTNYSLRLQGPVSSLTPVPKRQSPLPLHPLVSV